MIYVVYGSQTGNSEEIAKRINKEIREKLKTSHVEFLVMNKFLTHIQKFPENKFQKHIVVAVCSTTGAGDAPTNSDAFVRWIKRKTHASDTLSNVYYTVLGLGDSNYTKYQAVPRLVDDGLHKIGAKKFYARGEADDAYGLEIVVEPWIDGLYPVLEKLYKEINAEMKGKEYDMISCSTSNSSLSDLSIKDENEKKSERKKSDLISRAGIGHNAMPYLNSKILAKNLISGKKSEKEIYSILLNQGKDNSQGDKEKDQQLNFSDYQPGAYISILPSESEERISKIKTVINQSHPSSKNISETDKILIIDKSNHFNIYSDFNEKFPHFNNLLKKGYVSFDEVIKYIIDFDSVLKKSQAENIRQLIKLKIGHTHTELINKFEALFTKYTEMILRNRISLYDIITSLSMFEVKLDMTIIEMLECLPIKYPRNYSLASYGFENDKNPLEIVFSVVQDRIIRKFPNIKSQNLPLGIKAGEFYYKGQTTNFHKRCKEGESIFISEINTCFKFPLESFLNNRKPIIYICNGTGITPCISFLKQILSMADKLNPDTIGELIILTGFRSASVDRNETVHEDFINESMEFINKRMRKDVISYLRCLSVCSENEEEEVGIWRNYRINTKYVQDLILENEEKIYKVIFLLSGYLMICGDIAKLYDECIANIMSIIMKKQGYHREHSVKYLEDMKFMGRLIIEKWN